MASTFPGIDRDVAVTGALLHDIGKLDAYTAEPAAIDLTDAGRLQGEIPLGYYRIRRAIEDLPGFPAPTAQALLHIVLSHHGSLEHGSPVVPCTREAWLVHMIDNLGGKLGSFDRLEKGLAPGRGVDRVRSRRRRQRLLRAARRRARAARRLTGPERPSRRPSRPIKRRSVGPNTRWPASAPCPRDRTPWVQGRRRALLIRPRGPSCVRAACRSAADAPTTGRSCAAHDRLLVALLLLLALAPAASAHDESDPNHRDTPADLAAADIDHTLALAHLSRTVAPDLPQYLPTTWCGAANRSTDDTAHAAFPAGAASDQDRLRARARPARRLRSLEGRAADQRLAHRAVPGAADGRPARAALRHGHGVRPAVRRHPGRRTCPPTAAPTSWAATTSNFYAVADDVATAVVDTDRARRVHPRRRADRRRPRSRPRDGVNGVWGIAQVSPTTRPARQLRQRGRPDGDDAGPRPRRTPDPWDWQPTVMLHEITHNLGGVQQSAPHSTPFAHCWDGSDVMCYSDGSSGSQPYTTRRVPHHRGGAIPQTYDCGHDDYFNPDPGAGQLPGHALERLHAAPSWARARSSAWRAATRSSPSPPVNTALPAVAGQAEPGARAHRHGGTWLNSPTSYAHPVAARRRRRLGDHPGRGRARLPRHRPPTPAPPCAWS